tara:strand:+ start:38 stop:250 length:213 start_codon:yes stop_codon:yes gene_type:complete
MPKIFFCGESASFTETEVESTNVGQLRRELGLENETINVNRDVATDDVTLRDDDRVAAVKTNKKGGKHAS